ncbi:hypothetical protein Vadar_034433 [Vaccinium darrowii]|uniref:Uncharacterized protein n=1 Tax=Vaccinium darrowii TaxID=229202 RepID=A0ACB7XEB8_9ERIC|nr:hypothetical protein Vadar_034433 [Vaccinium darrowii]
MAEPPSPPYLKDNKFLKGVFAVVGIMSTLVIYGVLQRNGGGLEPGDAPSMQMVEKVNFLQEKIMTVPYGVKKEYFKFSLFLVFCNRLTTSAVSAGALLARKKALDPVAPVYKYCLVSISNILTTTCQYEALKYVNFPIQTLAKCAKMIPVMVATASQFFISYTIRTFGALTFATIMTTRQLVSILLSCVWFVHPLSWEQCIGAVIVFGSLYAKSFLKNKPQKPSQLQQSEDGGIDSP